MDLSQLLQPHAIHDNFIRYFNYKKNVKSNQKCYSKGQVFKNKNNFESLFLSKNNLVLNQVKFIDHCQSLTIPSQPQLMTVVG